MYRYLITVIMCITAATSAHAGAISAHGFPNLSTANLSVSTVGQTLRVSKPIDCGTLTINRDLDVERGGKIRYSGHLTVARDITAGDYQIFEPVGPAASLTILTPPTNGIYASWVGVKGDNSTDNNDTYGSTSTPMGRLFAALPATGFKLIFSRGGVYRYTKTSVLNRDDFEIVGNGAILKALNSAPISAQGGGINFYNCNKYHVHDLTVDGNRDNRGTLVDIAIASNLIVQSGSDFVFERVKSINSIVDGLYVLAADPTSLASIPITGAFTDCTFDNSARQGYSGINNFNLRFTRCRFTNSHGMEPESGVDMEPNYAAGNVRLSIDNVVFDNCVFSDNYGYGYVASNWEASPDYSATMINHISFVNGCVFENNGDGAIYTAHPININNAVFRNVTGLSGRAVVDFFLDPRSAGVLENSRFEDIDLPAGKFTVLSSSTGADPTVQYGLGNVRVIGDTFRNVDYPLQISGRGEEVSGNTIISATAGPAIKINAKNSYVHGNTVISATSNIGIELGSDGAGSVISNNMSYTSTPYIGSLLTPGAVIVGNHDSTGLWAGNTGGDTVALSGSGAPTMVPSYVKQEYIDTTNNKWYKAKGVASSADWLLLN